MSDSQLIVRKQGYCVRISLNIHGTNHSRSYNGLYTHLYTTFQITTNTIIINETYSF